MYLGVHVKDYTLKYAPFSGYQTWQMEESEDITQIYFKTAVLPVPNLATIFASLRLKILLQASEQLVRPVSIITTGAAENLIIYAKECLTHSLCGEYSATFRYESTAGLR